MYTQPDLWGSEIIRRQSARLALGLAVRRGQIQRPETCSDCGKPHRKVQGHHPDYDKPYDVVWLCPPCHRKQHPRPKRRKLVRRRFKRVLKINKYEAEAIRCKYAKGGVTMTELAKGFSVNVAYISQIIHHKCHRPGPRAPRYFIGPAYRARSQNVG